MTAAPLTTAELYALNDEITARLSDEHGVSIRNEDQEDLLNDLVHEIANLRAKERTIVAEHARAIKDLSSENADTPSEFVNQLDE